MIVAVHHDLRDHGCHRAIDAAPGELVVQRARDHVADGALGVGADDVQRGLVDLAGRQLVATQDEPNLRAVAMGHDHVPALDDHVGDVFAGLLDGIDLRRDILVALVQNQRVAADCNDGGERGFGHLGNTSEYVYRY